MQEVGAKGPDHESPFSARTGAVPPSPSSRVVAEPDFDN